jgi:CDP-2,3-bis-(O-geranylgeranyl)-sn-glycerol synthase
MIPPIARRMKLCDFLDKPVDFNKTFNGKPFLGSHKTWRGVICGILLGLIVIWLQIKLFQFPAVQEISFFDYSGPDVWVFGLLMTTGAVFGDLLFAFVKRRLNIEPGGPFMPLDQTNYVVGAAIFLTGFLKLNIMVWVTLFIATFLLHILFNRIGYLLGIHKNKW